MSEKVLRFAVILAGCGNKDGAEIHESVLTLLSVDRAGHQYCEAEHGSDSAFHRVSP